MEGSEDQDLVPPQAIDQPEIAAAEWNSKVVGMALQLHRVVWDRIIREMIDQIDHLA